MGFLAQNYIPVLAGVLGTLLIVGGVFWWRSRASLEEINLQRKSRLLSPAERSFFDCLIPALSEDFYIFTKVAIQDVVTPSPTAGYFEKRSIHKTLHGQTLDYVLCKKHDLSIFGVIELENFEKRANRNDRFRREKMINEVCKSAHLRLFYFDIRQDYQGVDIQRLVTGYSSKQKESENSGSARSQFTIDNSSYAAFAKQRTCPQCNGEVVTKVAVKGKRIGEKFLMCRKYPYCDYRVAMNDKDVAETMRDSTQNKNNVVRPGFKDWSAG
jgi:hypothetical protein